VESRNIWRDVYMGETISKRSASASAGFRRVVEISAVIGDVREWVVTQLRRPCSISRGRVGSAVRSRCREAGLYVCADPAGGFGAPGFVRALGARGVVG